MIEVVPGEALYDSAHVDRGVMSSLKFVLDHRALVALLVRKELAVRYRRSALGVVWALLTPALTTLVLWVVFESVFPVANLGVPYAVYLASGVLVLTAVQQGVQLLAGSLQGYEPLLARMPVPAEALAAGTIGAIGVHVGLGMVVVLALQLALGVGVPWTAPLGLVVLALLLAFSAGLGMLLAGLALRLADVLQIVSVVLYLLGFLTPTFYPLSAISDPARTIIEANPLTSFVELLRACLYEGSVGPVGKWAVSIVLGVATLVAGLDVYGRSARRAVAR
jgi:lipopolysaccharide transport system permease protein